MNNAVIAPALPLLQLQQLTITQAQRTLCQDLNLVIQSGQRWLILGQNGCGKSTLLATLAGWHAPQSGIVQLKHQSLAHWPARQRAQQLAWLHQQDETPFPMQVLEKVLTGCHARLSRFAWESTEDRLQALTLLGQLDLAGFATRDLATLSGGERRRVSLATVLMQDTPLLLLDEPLSQLDIHHQQQTLQLLASSYAQRAMMMVSHDPNHAWHFATHALLLFGDGRWVAGTVDQTLTAAHLSQLYQYPIKKITAQNDQWFIPSG
ncbi:MAG: ABC transporter ATP-binding protein [Pseudomonadota bacterium]|nr:ABC transporter ATP-binding protein [Pseudomonadota bacterium]